ncbi:MAG: hypothetical protein JWP64_5259 [Pseudonocardia sp.]|jgi:hypothetical protein|uniref:hypothetical protein n=1 Tax=Pseudonocardia sp. TaxID=60912 RepID=UPI0026107423|nr:hypothetical protein [Pseudonocardia sp.]MCU1630310.1 hypothetical protein [Pseudonocardia sp.]MDT7700170.1 hypothetical protein [Pseudonocardiales bacterium]HEV7470814.1 hypothetical protein [Pseudonocardia sp.]
MTGRHRTAPTASRGRNVSRGTAGPRRLLTAVVPAMVAASLGTGFALTSGGAAGATDRAIEDAAPATVVRTVAPADTVYTCEPDATPRFEDPAEPDTITNKACGYTDENGRARSLDPWVDGQLLADLAR